MLMTLLPHSPDHPCENCHILKIVYNQLFLIQVANISEAQLICDSSRTREWSQKFFLCLFAAVLEMILQPGLVQEGKETEDLTMLYLLGNDGRPAVAQLLLRLHHRLFPPPPILQFLFPSSSFRLVCILPPVLCSDRYSMHFRATHNQ